MTALNVPLGPPELAILFLLVALVPAVVYRDARKRDIDHPVRVSAILFVQLLIGVVPGVLGLVLYVSLREPIDD